MRYTIIAASIVAIAFGQVIGDCVHGDGIITDPQTCEWCCSGKCDDGTSTCSPDPATTTFESPTPVSFEPQCQVNGGACETSFDCCGDIDLFCNKNVCSTELQFTQ